MEIFKELNELINHYEIVPFIAGRVKDEFTTTINLIKDYIEKDLKEVSFEDEENIYKSSKLLVALMVEREVTKNIEISFTKKMCYLIYNWNENYSKNNDIKNNVLFVQNYIDKSLTLDETLDILRNITARLERNMKSDLPTFKLSDHYFNLVKEEK